MGQGSLPLFRMATAGVRVALAALLFLFSVAPRTEAGPMHVEDTFSPQCGELLPDPPPGGWLLWSSPATWPGGQVPGVGAGRGANVTIPCNRGMLLDLPLVLLTVLEIQGSLKVKDDPSLPLVNLTAAFVVVKGRFIIGSTTEQFSHKVEIRLMPNPSNRANYSFTSPLPAEPAYPRSIGHKAFAVVGGQVDFHGLPGSPSMLTWTRLAATAPAGASSLTVKGNVADWPVGSPIVVAPSDYRPNQEDVRTITAVSCGASSCTMSLDKALTYNHFSSLIPDGFGGSIEEAAEVALLSRNIVITGTDEPSPHALEGGHFIVYMTPTQQLIEGVEFLLMGQQGHLGRYNIHFHVCKEQNNSVIRKNLVLHSKQRCVVIHATFNAVVDGNVAYNTSGHCFMIEEGSEHGNTFINNFGLRTRAVTQLIAADETDNTPATFWITNPNNSYIGNAAGGSDDSGFWIELRDRVRGMSLGWSRVNQTIPVTLSTVGQYSGNGAHSNTAAGFKIYPRGYYPRLNATVDNPNYDKPVWVELGNFNLWKNEGVGTILHDAEQFVFSNSTLADNRWAVQMSVEQGINITGLRIVGLSNNYGNPSYCDKPWGTFACQPVSGCTLPVSAGAPGRSVVQGSGNKTILGVVFTENRQGQDGRLVNLLANTSFSSFDNECHPAAAIGITGVRGSFWSAGHGFESVRFSSSTKTNKVFFFSKDFVDAGNAEYHAGEPATMFALRDIDGSVIGSPGYLVANNSRILPPLTASPQCTVNKDFNAYSCPQTCYRTVQAMYDEPGFAPYPAPTTPAAATDSPRLLGSFSYLTVLRVEDGTTLTLAGNLHQYRTSFDNGAGPYNDSTRLFPMSLLGGYTYEISIVPPTGNINFVPKQVVIQYKDGQGCGQGVTLRLKGSAAAKYSWAVQPSDTTTWAPCPGNSVPLSSRVAPVPFSFVCSASSSPPAQALELSLTPALQPMAPVVVDAVPGAPAACGASSSRCGLIATNTAWDYNPLSQDLHPTYDGGAAFYNPLYPTAPPGWSRGPGLFAFRGGLGAPGAMTYLQSLPPVQRTYYFKTSFSVTRSSCYSQLLLDVVVLDGVVLYLNNVELMRANMPAGAVTNSTLPLSETLAGPQANKPYYTYSSFALPLSAPGVNYSLAEGTNYVAAEVNVRGWQTAFAVRASAILNNACSAPKVAKEVCDGVDNDADGTVDVDPTTGKTFQRPCWTACGAGLQTCIRGAYQNCTAPKVYPEICNGKDDNCDGLVDNGNGQLDCPAGNVCFAGKCQPFQPLTAPQVMWGPRASGWFYNDKGNDMTAYPTWKKGARPRGNWSQGTGNFGLYPSNTSWHFTTLLASNSKGNIWTRYFVKNFSLPDATSTFGFSLGLQRDSGAVVYLNGQEILRSNMPSGPIAFTTLASEYMGCQNPVWSCYAFRYLALGPLRAYGVPAMGGTNTLAVELHVQSQWAQDAAFDLSLTRHVIQPCASAGTCVRNPPADTLFIKQGDVWKILDASLPLPASSWFKPGFDDSSWLSGPTRIGRGPYTGFNMTYGSTAGNGRMTYFFRKALAVPDGACYYNLTMNIFNNDGAVVYINGAEASRFNMPSGNITVTTPAAQGPTWKFSTVALSSGWLLSGTNVFAIELHQALSTTGNYMFDFNLTGKREGVSCSPLPL